MAPLPARIAQELANSLQDFASVADAVATGQQADFIKSGTPESVWGKVQQETARQYCRRYADDPGAGGDFLGYVAETKCRPYLDDIGYGTGPEVKKPFEGGQCVGALYTVELGQIIGGTCGTIQNISGLVGPITGISLVTTPSGSFPNTLTGTLTIQTATGPVVRTQPGSESNPPCYTGPFITSLPEDSCGNPPPEFTEPVPPGTPAPRPEPFNPSPDIDIDIDVEINPDGTIDVDFGTGPITISPDFGGDGDSGPGTDPVPTDPGFPGDSGATGDGGTDEGEAPEGAELVGVLVDVVSAPPLANTFGRTTQTVYRGVGYVQMGYPGRLGTDVSGGAVISPQFFHAQQRGLTSHKVSANLGYSLTVTPYYRDINP